MVHYLVARGIKGATKRIDDIDLPRLGRTITRFEALMDRRQSLKEEQKDAP